MRKMQVRETQKRPEWVWYASARSNKGERTQGKWLVGGGRGAKKSVGEKRFGLVLVWGRIERSGNGQQLEEAAVAACLDNAERSRGGYEPRLVKEVLL